MSEVGAAGAVTAAGLLSTNVGSWDLIPAGDYDGVIAETEVRAGGKGPYVSVAVTLWDEDHRGRRVWGTCSFAEGALGMPGGPANLLQTVRDQLGEVPLERSGREVVSWLAEGVVGCAVRVELDHEQVVRGGIPQTNLDGSPELRARIREYTPAAEDFVKRVAERVSGVDTDLPF